MSEQNETGIFAEERKRRIVIYVNQHGRVTVTELCAEFSVSPATMRNDLQALHERGLLKRTHGGAMANTQANFEPSSNEKLEKFLKEKQAIAREALKYIHEGDSIALDAGTTVYELAKLLGQFKKLRVVTYDLNIASYLDANTDVSLFVAGGEVRRGHHYMIKERIIPNARKRILLADSSKIDNISFAKFADIADLNTFITDSNGDEEMLQQLREAGVKVDVAVVEEN